MFRAVKHLRDKKSNLQAAAAYQNLEAALMRTIKRRGLAIHDS